MQRYTAARPCPICGGWEARARGQGERCAGYLAGSGKVAWCTREELSGSLPLDEHVEPAAYRHTLSGDCACGTRHAPETSPARRVEAIYDYRGPEFDLRYQVVRYWPKDFRQRHPDGFGGFVWSVRDLDPHSFVPYRLPELLASVGMAVCLEGEKAVDACRELGLSATTAAMGDWKPAVAAYLHGRDVVVVADNDSTGRRKAVKAAEALHSAGARVRLMSLGDLPAGAGLDDWFAAGQTVEAFNALWPEIAEYRPVHTGTNGHGPAPPPVEGEGGEGPGPRGLLFTDTRNALRLTAQHGERVRFDFTRGLWRIWDETRWQLDEQEQIFKLAKGVVSSMYAEIEAADPPAETRGKLVGQVLAVESQDA